MVLDFISDTQNVVKNHFKTTKKCLAFLNNIVIICMEPVKLHLSHNLSTNHQLLTLQNYYLLTKHWKLRNVAYFVG